MSSLLLQTLAPHAQALDRLARRQELLAANIANADTPGYQPKDLDFQRLLSASLARPALAQTDAGHLGGGASRQLPVLERPSAQGSFDRNSVDLDWERSQFTANALRYEAQLAFLNAEIKKLTTVLQG